MIRIAIVEDNENEAKTLSSLLERYGRDHGEEFQIRHFQNALRFLDQYQPDFELIFMDIDMPYMNGIEATKKLRQIDENVVLLFVTALAQYAVQGYGVGALDFLVKPINYAIFESKMGRAMNAMKKKEIIKNTIMMPDTHFPAAANRSDGFLMLRMNAGTSSTRP